MRDLRRRVRLLWSVVVRDNPRLVAAAVGLDLLVNVAGRPLAGLWLKVIVDGATAGDGDAVAWAGVALAGSLALQGTGSVGTAMLFGDLHESSARVLIGDVMRLSAATPGIEHHERPEYADRIALLRGQSRLLTNFVNTFGSSAALVVRVAVTVVLLASVHPALLALPVLALPSVWAGQRANAIVERAKEATAEAVRSEEHLWKVTTTPGPAKEIRVFNLGDHLVERHRRLWDTVTRDMAAAQVRAGTLRALGWSSFAAGYVGAIALVLSLASRGAASPGDVLLVIALASDVNAQVARAAALAGESAGTFLALDRLQWLSDYAEAARRPAEDPAPVPDRLVDGISFEGVKFSYPGTEMQVLADVDLRLPAGGVVALVGANGAGKTTLVKLLTGCYQPTVGRITVDGIDLRRLDLEQWRRRVSAGFQDYFRFQETLKRSVGMGDLDHLDDAAAVAAALERGQATDLVDALPGGLQALLGKEFEGGTDLSEGQWQKVAISRALMLETPLLLVLDEPTSGLDAEAEHALFEHYASAASRAARAVGAVTVLVSHRFSTVRLADLIVVVDAGRICEQGSHEELLATKGLYAELYGLQAQAYR